MLCRTPRQNSEVGIWPPLVVLADTGFARRRSSRFLFYTSVFCRHAYRFSIAKIFARQNDRTKVKKNA